MIIVKRLKLGYLSRLFDVILSSFPALYPVKVPTAHNRYASYDYDFDVTYSHLAKGQKVA